MTELLQQTPDYFESFRIPGLNERYRAVEIHKVPEYDLEGTLQGASFFLRCYPTYTTKGFEEIIETLLKSVGENSPTSNEQFNPLELRGNLQRALNLLQFSRPGTEDPETERKLWALLQLSRAYTLDAQELLDTILLKKENNPS